MATGNASGGESAARVRTRRRRFACGLALAAAAALALAAAGHGRAPVRDCGDDVRPGFSIVAITAVNVGCREARAVARATPARCSPRGVVRPTCTVRGFLCLVARAGKELFFARCSVARPNDELFRVVRFEYGS
jgi:hypothetical protein